MKLRITLILSFCFFFFFGLKAQNSITDVSFSASYYQKDLSEILVDISKRTKVNISFESTLVEPHKNISLQIKNEKLGDVLDVLLSGKKLEYVIAGQQIVILAEDPSIKEFELPTMELSGYIEDAESGERLPFAYLYTKDGEISIATNEYGFYSVEVPKGTEGLYVSFLGYEDTFVTLDELKNKNFSVSMQSDTELEEVIIEENLAEDPIIEYDRFNTTELEKMKDLQTFGGQMDILRHVQTMPGITTGADGIGGNSVRGANVDNNLILLDGIPVYNSSHALGVFSIFDQASIKSARFYRSHIPSRYGGRLASVLDIRTKEGNLHSIGGEVSLGLLTSSFFLEGPIIKDRLSFAVSARRTLFEPYLGGLSSFVKAASDREGETNYYFYDVNAKVQYVLDARNRIYLSYYGGLDHFADNSIGMKTLDTLQSETEDIYDWKWGNNLAALRWSSQFSSTVFSNLSVFNTSYKFSAYNYSRQQLNDELEPVYYSNVASLFDTKINDWGVKWDLDYYIDDKNRSKIGLLALNHQFLPGLYSRRNYDPDISSASFRDTLDNSLIPEKRNANELELYYEHEYRYKNILVNAGGRLSLLNAESRNYFSLQPRVSVKGLMSKGLYGKFNANYTTQYLHLLASTGLGLPTDIWIPSTERIRPQKAVHLSTGLEYELAKGLNITSEVYYKYMWDILNLKEGAVFSVIEDEDWESDIPVGQGTAYGWETSVMGQYGNHYMNVNYTLAYSTRKFDDINAGRRFYSRFDRRHQINAAYQYSFNENIGLNLQYVLATGHPITLPKLISQGQVTFTDKHSQRLPRYDRLDVTLRISNEFNWGEQVISIGAYNVYNKQNPYYYFVDFETPTEFQLKQISIFPILPNISYSLKF